MYYRSLSIVAVVGLSFGLCACSPKATQNDLNAQNSALPDSANAPSPGTEGAKTGDSAQADAAPTEPCLLYTSPSPRD